ncbi:hypothetical protein EZV62_001665 [Acer yangbiense]|uniref:Uncharacterized protein n=1 Tax=Acer yangbiense TaxID=1000413 RepID=A0A5C7IX44_9ROSI|nr:hypothetical protein EZV62_001665 [Acer yangbiense]
MEHHREVIVHANASNEKNDKKSDTKRKERMVRRLPIEDGKGYINELADAFIKNFRNHNEKNDKKSDTKRKERMVRRLPVEDGKGDINELADAFIKNFRNQLRIQREESFKRFQEMIARGV